jgi:hypothetical protein
MKRISGAQVAGNDLKARRGCQKIEGVKSRAVYIS